ncbi:MAG: outer membrane protein assembly factor BamD [Candidatus Binatia bacterium]
MSKNFAPSHSRMPDDRGEMTAAMFHTPSNRQNFVSSVRQFAPRSLLLACMALSAGCSSGSLPSFPSLPPLPSLPWSAPASQPNASAETLYKEGMEFFNKKRYTLAIERFQKLRSEHPFAPEVVAAEFKLGEAYYLNQQYTEAVETLKEFQAMHPSNENVPYAVYLSGMAHFDQFTSIDRDQKVTEIAKGYFERVINNYAQSPYAAKSREKLTKCLEYLAEHEFYIASFYIGEKKYPAARDRLEGILRLYRNTPTAAKALYQLGESYRLEKNNVKASLAYEALVEHYPTDPLAKTAQAQLKELAQEKRDPLAALLKPEGRAAPVVAENKAPSGEAKPPENFVAKTEFVDEKPGEEKTFLGRMVDKINPFAPPTQIVSPAPASASSSSDEKKDQAAKANAAGKKESGGFFSSLWPFGKKQESGADTKTASAKSSPLVGNIDDSLKQRGIDAKQVSDPTPPAADLPKEPPPAKVTTNPTATLGAIDSKLDKQGKNIGALPAPPEAAPVLKTPYDEKAVAKAKAAASPAPDTGSLLSNIDQKLKGQGIDAAKAEEAINKKTEEAPKRAPPRPKPTETINLEPRLSTEKSPLFLQPQEFQPQERSAAGAEPEQSATSAPAKAEAAPQPQTLPELAIKGPPQPAKEKPAETKTAKKPTSSDGEEEVEEKGALEQLKEDVGKIGRILNPFNW